MLRRHTAAAATVHKTLRALDVKGIIREDEGAKEVVPRYRLEDPFLGAWLRHVQDGAGS